ncbi:MAG: VTT domain-containing protein [Acetobacteraceae bacterium]
MHAFVDWAVAFAADHALLAYALVLVLAAGESLPVFGALIPGTTVIIAMATMIAAGALDYWPYVAGVAVGAVLGDGVSYVLGRRYQRAILDRWPLSRHPELARRGEALFARHGGLSVVISRFTPAVRAIIPMLAGILEMSPARFFGADVPAAIVWALSHVLFGVLVGASLELLGAVAGRVALLVGLLIVLAWAVVWVARWLARWLPRAIAAAVEPVARWAERNPSWIARHLRGAFAANRAEALTLAVIAALLAGGLWLLAGALQDLIAGDPLVRVDGVVLHALAALRSIWGDHVMQLVAATAAPAALLLLAVLTAAVLVVLRQWPLLVAWVLGLAGAVVLGTLLLLLPNAAPPQAAFAHTLLPPSAEALLAATIFGLLAFFAMRAATAPLQPAIASAALLLVVFGAAARLYFGQTLLSTEIIAIAFALAWVGLTAAVAEFRRLPAERAWPASLLAIPVLIGAVVAEAAGYAMVPALPLPAQLPPRVMSLAAWRDGGWGTLPGTRVGLLGNYTRPFTLQWAGSTESLAGVLEARGWSRAPSWTLLSAAGWLAPRIDPATLPVLPRLADGRPEALVMIRPLASAAAPERMVLRLWSSGAAIGQGSHHVPLWLGVLAEEHLHRVAGTLTLARGTPAPRIKLAELALALPAARVVVDRGIAPRRRHSNPHAPVLLGWEPAPAAGLCRPPPCPHGGSSP